MWARSSSVYEPLLRFTERTPILRCCTYLIYVATERIQKKKAAQQSFFYILSRLKIVHTLKWVLYLFCTPCKSKSPPVLWLNGWWVEKERRVGSRGPRRFFFSFFSLTARLLCLDPWGNGMETVAVATHYMYNNILSTKIISPTFIWHKQIYWKPRKKATTQ